MRLAAHIRGNFCRLLPFVLITVLSVNVVTAPAWAGTSGALPEPNANCLGQEGDAPAAATPWAQQALDYSSVWGLTQGQGIKVAVIDSGVDDNPQFRDRVIVKQTLAPAPSGPAAGDCVGHGTMVAGIIAAAPMSGVGFEGVAPRATIISIKITNTRANISADTVALAIHDAVEDGANVINLSLTAPNTPALRSAVKFALRSNVVVVAAVGSDTTSSGTGPFYPAAYRGVLSVGAVEPDGTLAPFSDLQTPVTVTAPGEDVTSTFPGVFPHSYVLSQSGTSFAAPFVSGVAALVRAANPSLTEAQVVQRIRGTADGAAGLGTGNGMVNPVLAVTAVSSTVGNSRGFVPVNTAVPRNWLGLALTVSVAAGIFVLTAAVLMIAVGVSSGRRRRSHGTDSHVLGQLRQKLRSQALPPGLRPLNFGSLSSLLVALIVAGVFGILGLLSPGNTARLTNPGTVVVDAHTGMFYVPCDFGKLCPALNYASALLALRSANVNRVVVSHATLSHHEIGPTIGIPGLPDLPEAGDLVRGPWAVCVQRTGQHPVYARSTLVGGRAVGGTPMEASQAALATTQGGFQDDDWLLWNGQRLQISPDMVATLFGKASPPTVPTSWLDAIPQGPNVAAPTITGQGHPVTGPLGPALVGQVFVVPSATGQKFYVLEANGKLTAMSPFQVDLLERVSGLAKPQRISASRAAGDLSGASLPSGGLPAQVPRLSAIPSPLCVSYYGPGSALLITVGGTVPAGTVPVTAGPVFYGVNQVWLPPDHGALVGVTPDSGEPSVVTGWFLVVGGARYALPSKGVAEVLGYDLSEEQTVLPAGLVELLPQGPVMDPYAATVPMKPGTS